MERTLSSIGKIRKGMSPYHLHRLRSRPWSNHFGESSRDLGMDYNGRLSSPCCKNLPNTVIAVRNSYSPSGQKLGTYQITELISNTGAMRALASLLRKLSR